MHGTVRKSHHGFIFGAREYAAAVKHNLSWHIKYSEDLLTNGFIFVGTQLSEPDLDVYVQYRSSLLSKSKTAEPKSFLIVTDVDDVVMYEMQRNGILCIEAKSEEFFSWLAQSCTTKLRRSELVGRQLPRIAQYKSEESKKSYIRFSTQFRQIFADQIEPSPNLEIHDFFAGDAPTWWDINQKNDAVLTVVDDCMDELLHNRNPLVVLIGSSGCGKTTSLMRIAIKCADLKWQVYYYEDLSDIDVDAAFRVLKTTQGTPTVVLIERAADNVDQLDSLVKKLDLSGTSSKLNIRFVLEERENRFKRVEVGATFGNLVIKEMRQLSLVDIERIIDKLEEKDKLRTLRGQSRDSQINFFRQYADKQLLVAMKEVMSGARFDQIISREFAEVHSQLAQEIYSVVALCHSLQIPINIKVVHRQFSSRMHYDELRSMIAEGELRGLVLLKRDFLYTRHAVIAKEILRSPDVAKFLTRRKKANIIIDLMIALAPSVNKNSLPRGTPEARLVSRLMDFDHIDNVLGRDRDSIEMFFASIRDYYDWNSKYWAQRGLFESERRRFADAIDYVNYAADRDSHWTILNSQGVVYMRSACSVWAATYENARHYYDAGIACLERVCTLRNQCDLKVIEVILRYTYEFLKNWPENTDPALIDLFKRYLNIGKNSRVANQPFMAYLQHIHGEMIKLSLKL